MKLSLKLFLFHFLLLILPATFSFAQNPEEPILQPEIEESQPQELADPSQQPDFHNSILQPEIEESQPQELAEPSPQPDFHNSLLLSKTYQSQEEKEMVTLYDNGFYFSGQGNALRIGGWAQIDYRDFIGKHPSKDTFLVRRAQVQFRGVFADNFSYALYINALRGSARLGEAWLEYRQYPSAQVRIGLFKLPFSCEEIYSSRWIYFIERSLVVTNLAPFFDIAVQLFGRIFDGRVVYAIAYFNEQDSPAFRTDNGKGVAGRLLLQPFKGCPDSQFGRLFLGGSFTVADIDQVVDNLRYRTAARSVFLTFNPTDFEDGTQYRAGVEIQWFNGPFVANSEYIVSQRHHVVNLGSKGTVSSDGWYVSASYILTGETQPRNGPVQPYYPFNPRCSYWGAWEIGARYEQFRTNSKAFERGLVTGARFLSAITAGITWWPNEHIKFVGNFVYTDFHKKILIGDVFLDHETNLLFRAQFNF